MPSTNLGKLGPIKTLPGMVRAAVNTLDKIWGANVDPSNGAHPRLKSLQGLEREVLRRLPPNMKTPRQLVDLTLARIRHAPAVLGPLEIHGYSEMTLPRGERHSVIKAPAIDVATAQSSWWVAISPFIDKDDSCGERHRVVMHFRLKMVR